MEAGERVVSRKGFRMFRQLDNHHGSAVGMPSVELLACVQPLTPATILPLFQLNAHTSALNRGR